MYCVCVVVVVVVVQLNPDYPAERGRGLILRQREISRYFHFQNMIFEDFLPNG